MSMPVKMYTTLQGTKYVAHDDGTYTRDGVSLLTMKYMDESSVKQLYKKRTRDVTDKNEMQKLRENFQTVFLGRVLYKRKEGEKYHVSSVVSNQKDFRASQQSLDSSVTNSEDDFSAFIDEELGET